MNEVSELQKRRAENMIWNAAQNHTFTPDFKAYDQLQNHYNYLFVFDFYNYFQQVTIDPYYKNYLYFYYNLYHLYQLKFFYLY